MGEPICIGNTIMFAENGERVPTNSPRKVDGAGGGRSAAEGGFFFFGRRPATSRRRRPLYAFFHHLSFRLAMHNNRLVLVTLCLGIDIPDKQSLEKPSVTLYSLRTVSVYPLTAHAKSTRLGFYNSRSQLPTQRQ